MPRPTPHPTLALIAVAALATAPDLVAATPQRADTLEIYAVHGSEAELDVIDQLRSVLDAYDTSAWEVAPVVRVDQTQIPHSHPVLTVHTRLRGDPDGLLALYLHEQFHWWVLERSEALENARVDLRAHYPEAPIASPRGAGSERSNLLHLVVCHLEYRAMVSLVGEDRARETLRANRHYTWIYETVLNDPELPRILERHGLVVG